MSELVLYEPRGPVAYITFNRPEKLNAFSADMLGAFMSALDRAEADDSVRVVILRGAGRAFSAGYDIVPAPGTPKKERTITSDRENIQGLIGKWLRVYEFPKPVIAQVHGYCIAGATMLAICADITIVAKDAKIRWPSLPIGAGLISTMWTWLVGPKKAKELSFVAGSEVSGADACDWGWANRAVDEADLERETYKLARAIAATPSDLLRIKKLAINRVMDVQGFRTAAEFGAEWDAIGHFSEGAKSMSAKIREMGLRDAITWFEAQKTAD